jgi:hypothetical protein
MLFGVYDNLKNHSSWAFSMYFAFYGTFFLSDSLEPKIKNLDPGAEWVSVVNGVRYYVTWPYSLTAGAGAAIGSGGVELVKWAIDELADAGKKPDR